MPEPSSDAVDAALGAAAPAVAALRDLRAAVRRHAQGAHDALFDPADPGDLPIPVRYAVAHRIASAAGQHELADRYSAGAADAESALPEPALSAVFRHVDLLTDAPATATSEDLAVLVAAGLPVTAIVTLSQLVGFLHAQLRIVAGLALLAGSPVSG